MQQKRLEFTTLLYSLPLLVALFSCAHIGENGEPFALALLLALGAAGVHIAIPSLVFVASAFSLGNLTHLWIYALQAVLLFGAFFLKNRLFPQDKKTGLFLPFSLFCAALILYIFLAPFQPYSLPFEGEFFHNAYIQKTAIALFLLLFASAATVGVNALIEKFLKCKFKGEELFFLLLVYCVLGVGFCRFFGLNAYLGVAFFILLAFCAISRDSLSLCCAFVLSLPSFLAAGAPIERFFVYGFAVFAFARAGKLGECLAFLAAFFFYGYLDGIYTYPTPQLVGLILSALIPTLAFLLLPRSLLSKLENELVFYREKHLSRLAINRNRAAIGQQLFEISALFREIQTTFLTLGNTDAEDGAKAHIKGCIVNSLCKKCSGYGTCSAQGLDGALEKLIAVGCIKGRASLIDIPAELAACCGRQSDILYALNAQFAEYRRYMLEAENAANGRQLLANQAQGVSEIIKNIALEQSEPLPMYSKKEQALSELLKKAGIVCSEILIYGGEDSPTVSLVTFGDATSQKIGAAATQLFDTPMMISEKLALSKNKYCYILHKKPPYDAAFGVATRVKDGESNSGDTHSVIKIDERRFLVALSDGMGSGEYAKRVSESTISLLEIFYRSKMPPELILSTVNRLLTFNKEETFACVDIAVVDLSRGRVDTVKIGSPVGFILSDTALQILESDSLPLGILECIHPDVSTYQFSTGDTLLFLSDGVTGAFSSTGDLFEVLKNVPKANPQQVADLILDTALKRYGGAAKDDMTALAVKIFAA
ncbi:MAG: SpoIIE family protein phosphatase [Clostridia bacterium]|nr:SpoIIE family protein phosphatase [Clostridia bacterium]